MSDVTPDIVRAVAKRMRESANDPHGNGRLTNHPYESANEKRPQGRPRLVAQKGRHMGLSLDSLSLSKGRNTPELNLHEG